MATWVAVLASSLLVFSSVGCASEQPPSAGAEPSVSNESVTKPKLPERISAANAPSFSLSSLETARIELNSPDWMEVAGGSIWVRLDLGTVVRVDPAQARVETRIPPSGEGQFSDCQVFGSSGDAIWTCSPFTGEVERISTSTSQITDSLGIPFYGSQGELVMASERLWVIDTSAESMAGINPDDNALGDPIAFGAACSGLAAADPIVWAACPWENQVLRIDTSTGEVTGRLELNEPGVVAVGDDLWVGFRGGVAQVNPESLSVEAVYDVQPGSGGEIYAGKDTIWIRCDGGPFLVGIDPVANRVLATVIDKELPSGGNLVDVDGQLWTTAFDDAALVRLRPPVR